MPNPALEWEDVPVSFWMMGRCSCPLLDDGKMFLHLLDMKMCRVLLEDGKMCIVQVEDGKMFLLLLDMKMCRVLLEEGKMFLLLLDNGKVFLFPAG